MCVSLDVRGGRDVSRPYENLRYALVFCEAALRLVFFGKIRKGIPFPLLL